MGIVIVGPAPPAAEGSRAVRPLANADVRRGATVRWPDRRLDH